MDSKKVVFGAGCFWGVEDSFSNIEGVLETRVGYAGGSVENPTYEKVCSGMTSHAEVVEVTYNPDVVSLQTLVSHFFSIHNPTTVDRQGADVGSQYRSIAFFSTEEERGIIEAVRDALPNSSEVVTEIVPTQPFYPAEEYHQKYIQKKGGGGTCFV